MNRLGIIGGLGPMATAYFMELITKMTLADKDQEHIDMFMISRPGIPDRTRYILGESKDSPLPAMIEVGKTLVEQQVSQIAIPCITAHYFHDELEKAIGIPIIHGIAETVQYLNERGYRKAGIMATDGTVRTGLFTTQLSEKNMTAVYPDAQGQAFVMDLIYEDVKAGRPVHMDKFTYVADQLRSKGAEVILLGCTELSMIKKEYSLQPGFLDVMEVLTKCCVERCGTLKEEYRELITGQTRE